MKSFTNYENPSCNRFQGSCCGYPIAACDLKVVRRPPVILNLFQKPAMNVHCQTLTNCSEGKLEQKLNAAFKTIFRNSKCFQRIKQKLYIYFSLEIKNQLNMYRNY